MDVPPTDLLGRWLLDREVDDRLGGERRAVTGFATLDLVLAGRVRWHEEGVMRWSGREVPVQRTLWIDRDGGGAGGDGGGSASDWTVRFEDGRSFHPWAVGETVEHPCAPDHYTGRIDVEVADAAAGSQPLRWAVEWRARGPRKDYLMRTLLTRPA